MAAEKGNFECVRILQEAGASVKVVSKVRCALRRLHVVCSDLVGCLAARSVYHHASCAVWTFEDCGVSGGPWCRPQPRKPGAEISSYAARS